VIYDSYLIFCQYRHLIFVILNEIHDYFGGQFCTEHNLRSRVPWSFKLIIIHFEHLFFHHCEELPIIIQICFDYINWLPSFACTSFQKRVVLLYLLISFVSYVLSRLEWYDFGIVVHTKYQVFFPNEGCRFEVVDVQLAQLVPIIVHGVWLFLVHDFVTDEFFVSS
jgi:hypothetical protein